MSRPSVLLGFAEADAAPEVVWSLVDAGVRVMAFARKGRASALRHSRHVACYEIAPPEFDLDAALADLHAVLRSMSSVGNGTPALLFPLDDTAVWLCNKAQLEPHWTLAGPRGTNAALALDKSLQITLARESGFNVPTTTLVRTAGDVQAFAVAEGFPLILKPAECVPTQHGRRYLCRTWVCANQGELERAIAEWGARVPLLAQTFIVGTGEGVFGIGALEGVRAWSAHRRLRMMNPQGSGSSACVSQPVPFDVKTKVSALVSKARWRGLFMIELLRDHAGKVWFVELNGRPWGSMALSRRQGLEYPAWQMGLALDAQSSAGLATTSVPGLVCRHLGRELMHLLFVLRGPKSKAHGNWPSFWRSLLRVIAVHRGDGVYNWRISDPKVFVADFYYTLHRNLFKSRN